MNDRLCNENGNRRTNIELHINRVEYIEWGQWIGNELVDYGMVRYIEWVKWLLNDTKLNSWLNIWVIQDLMTKWVFEWIIIEWTCLNKCWNDWDILEASMIYESKHVEW